MIAGIVGLAYTSIGILAEASSIDDVSALNWTQTIGFGILLTWILLKRIPDMDKEARKERVDQEERHERERTETETRYRNERQEAEERHREERQQYVSSLEKISNDIKQEILKLSNNLSE